jgi:hypothetical protein
MSPTQRAPLSNLYAFNPNPLHLFSDLGQSVVNFSASTILNGFSGWLADGAASLVAHVTQLMTSTTTTDLTPGTPGFFLPTGPMLQLTTMLVLPLLLVATIGAVLRRDLGRLGRTWGVALPGAMLGAGAAVELSAVGLQVTDALCRVVTSSLNPSLQQAYGKVARTLTGSLLTNSPFLAALLAAVFVLGGIMLWLELILRSAAIYLAVFFLPLALAGLVWPATSHWAKRMVETLVAVILSKFVVVVALSLAVRAVANGATADNVLAGGAMFLLAAFAPFTLLRFAPIIEASAIAHMEGVGRRPLHAADNLRSRAMAAGPDSAIGALIRGRGTSSSQEAPPAPSAVAGVDLAATGGQVDREFAAMTARGSGNAAPSFAGPAASASHADNGSPGGGSGVADNGSPGGRSRAIDATSSERVDG